MQHKFIGVIFYLIIQCGCLIILDENDDFRLWNNDGLVLICNTSEICDGYNRSLYNAPLKAARLPKGGATSYDHKYFAWFPCLDGNPYSGNLSRTFDTPFKFIGKMGITLVYKIDIRDEYKVKNYSHSCTSFGGAPFGSTPGADPPFTYMQLYVNDEAQDIVLTAENSTHHEYIMNTFVFHTKIVNNLTKLRFYFFSCGSPTFQYRHWVNFYLGEIMLYLL